MGDPTVSNTLIVREVAIAIWIHIQSIFLTESTTTPIWLSLHRVVGRSQETGEKTAISDFLGGGGNEKHDRARG